MTQLSNMPNSLELTEDDILFLEAQKRFTPTLKEVSKLLIRQQQLMLESNEVIEKLNQIINKPNE